MKGSGKILSVCDSTKYEKYKFALAKLYYVPKSTRNGLRVFWINCIAAPPIHVALQDLTAVSLSIHLATLWKELHVYRGFYGKDISSRDDILEINMSKTKI